ncbi:MAG: hypothetical protein RL291_138 [Pseudomonadota bacterium]|jgi:hypothetical protein
MKNHLTWAALSGVLVLAACSGAPTTGGSGLTTSSILDGQKAEQTELGITNDNPMARPLYAAYTAARADKCGFNFDAAALRSRYLAFEAQQQGAQPIAQVEKTYDQTYQKLRGALGEDACEGSKVANIKTALGRQLAGDFNAYFPAAKPAVAQCGFFTTCEDVDPNKKFDSRDFWRKVEDDRRGVRSK